MEFEFVKSCERLFIQPGNFLKRIKDNLYYEYVDEYFENSREILGFRGNGIYFLVNSKIIKQFFETEYNRIKIFRKKEI